MDKYSIICIIWLICYKKGIRRVQPDWKMAIFAVTVKQREGCLCQRKMKLRTRKWRLRVRYSKQVRKNRCHPFGTTKTGIKTKLRLPPTSVGAILFFSYVVSHAPQLLHPLQVMRLPQVAQCSRKNGSGVMMSVPKSVPSGILSRRGTLQPW